MATLLHHIQPWMQNSIVEAVERIEKKMAQPAERQIIEVHQRLEAFGLWFLVWTAPTVDLTNLQASMESLRADMDAILEAWVLKSKAQAC